MLFSPVMQVIAKKMNFFLSFLIFKINTSGLNCEERKLLLQQIMLLIPDENRLALQTLLLFLNDIAKHANTNEVK